jgi:SOS-response transcriptional repressor LexA
MGIKSTAPLTKQQRRLLEFIGTSMISNGVQPTYRDIANHFGFAGQNGVVCHMKALEKKGFISRSPKQGRAIRINWLRLGMTANDRMVAYLSRRFKSAVRDNSEA